MKDEPSKMVAIVGPTASGKTDLAVDLATRFEGEIVCADSRTVYRGMDIGTAKPTPQQRSQVPHHMLDLLDPNQRMTSAEFKGLAQQKIREINSRGRVPLIVGGSGLYIDAILYDYQFPQEAVYHGMVQLDGMSDHQLHQLLMAEDPEAGNRIDRNNRRRVVRAIKTAGQSRSKLEKVGAETLVLGLRLSKEVAQQRMAKRIEKMLEEGFIEEIKKIGEQYGWGSEAMTGIGYRAMAGVILGSKTVDQAKADWLRGDMGLWKRQMTWFRRNSAIKWLDAPEEAIGAVYSFLSASV